MHNISVWYCKNGKKIGTGKNLNDVRSIEHDVMTNKLVITYYNGGTYCKKKINMDNYGFEIKVMSNWNNIIWYK